MGTCAWGGDVTVKDAEGTVKLEDVTFTAQSGEILGIAGISGCGQKELLEAIAGLQKTESGSICYVKDDGTREELVGKDPTAIAFPSFQRTGWAWAWWDPWI